jgi:hypothetical protein
MPKYIKLFEEVSRSEFYSFETMDEFIPEYDFDNETDGKTAMILLLYHMVPLDELSRKIGGTIIDQLKLLDLNLLSPKTLQIPHIAGKLLTCIYATFDIIPTSYYIKLKKVFPELIEKYTNSGDFGLNMEFLEKFIDISNDTNLNVSVGKAGGKPLGVWTDNGGNTSIFALTIDAQLL